MPQVGSIGSSAYVAPNTLTTSLGSALSQYMGQFDQSLQSTVLVRSCVCICLILPLIGSVLVHTSSLLVLLFSPLTIHCCRQMGNSLPGGGVYDSAYDYLLAQAGNSSDSQSIFNNQYLVSLNFVPELASASITALFNGQVCIHCCIIVVGITLSRVLSYPEISLWFSHTCVLITALPQSSKRTQHRLKCHSAIH